MDREINTGSAYTEYLKFHWRDVKIIEAILDKQEVQLPTGIFLF